MTPISILFAISMYVEISQETRKYVSAEIFRETESIHTMCLTSEIRCTINDWCE